MTLSRKKKLAITAGVLIGSAAVLFLATREKAVGATALKLEAAVPVVPVAAHLPPALRAVSGWPFEQLPMLAKFDIPVARVVAIPITIPRPVYIRDVPVARMIPSEAAPEAGAAPLWLLPMAAGVGFGGGTASYASTTTPEPATLLLLSTGLALLGLKARRRRRE